MNEKQILLVKHSWSYVASQLDEVGNVFCKKLASINPELKPLLKQLNQEKRVHEIIVTVNHLVASLPDFSKADKYLLTLLAEYSNKGISRTYYDSALIAFLMTLEKKLGKKWNLEMRDSWIFVFASMHQHLIRKLQVPATLM